MTPPSAGNTYIIYYNIMEKNSFENNFRTCLIKSPVKGRVILASNSPRRRELLAMIVPEFTVDVPDNVREVYPPDTPVEEVPIFLSRLKSQAYRGALDDGDVIISADTVVIVDGLILGKAPDAETARCMLRLLSGRTHSVITGVTLRTGTQIQSFSSHTRVTFASLSDDEIDSYILAYKPFDKAGAYGIQEWIGAAAISRIDGSFYNVMGLPVHLLYRHLRAL